MKLNRLLSAAGFALFLWIRTAAPQAAAQDLQATVDALQLSIQIMQLQSTIDALNGSKPSPAQPQPTATLSPEQVSGGMMNWASQDSALYSTATPFNAQNMISMQNFPSMVRPLIPDDTPPVWKPPSTTRRVEITVGTYGQYPNIAEALKNIPKKAGEVMIFLTSDTQEPPDGFGIPIDRGIAYVQIHSSDGGVKNVRPSGRSFWFFCNGIPLVIGPEVVFTEKSMVMGGSITYDRHNVHANNSTIIVNGKAWWIYGGGQSGQKGHSSSVDNVFIIINGWVDRVYAGGRAIYGETNVNNALVVVNGTAEEIYCSGYTENPAAKTTVGRAKMMIYGWYSIYGLGRGAGEIYLMDPTGCY